MMCTAAASYIGDLRHAARQGRGSTDHGGGKWRPFEAFVQNKERAPAGGSSDRGSEAEQRTTGSPVQSDPPRSSQPFLAVRRHGSDSLMKSVDKNVPCL